MLLPKYLFYFLNSFLFDTKTTTGNLYIFVTLVKVHNILRLFFLPNMKNTFTLKLVKRPKYCLLNARRFYFLTTVTM
jgi:hypothetical protein